MRKKEGKRERGGERETRESECDMCVKERTRKRERDRESIFNKSWRVAKGAGNFIFQYFLLGY